jgi:hypothetical protein
MQLLSTHGTKQGFCANHSKFDTSAKQKKYMLAKHRILPPHSHVSHCRHRHLLDSPTPRCHCPPPPSLSLFAGPVRVARSHPYDLGVAHKPPQLDLGVATHHSHGSGLAALSLLPTRGWQRERERWRRWVGQF